MYSSNSGRWPGSTQPAGERMWAILTAVEPVLTRPTYSSISLGLLPAGVMRVGVEMSWGMGLFSEKRHGFDAGDLKSFPAAGVGATDFVLEQNEIALGFGKAGAVPFVGAGGEAVPFPAQEVAQFVGAANAAEGAVKIGRPGGRAFDEILAFFHG